VPQNTLRKLIPIAMARHFQQLQLPSTATGSNQESKPSTSPTLIPPTPSSVAPMATPASIFGPAMTALPRSKSEIEPEKSTSSTIENTQSKTNHAKLFEGVIYVVIEAYDEINADFQLQQLIDTNKDLQDQLAEGQIEGEIYHE